MTEQAIDPENCTHNKTDDEAVCRHCGEFLGYGRDWLDGGRYNEDGED